MLRLTRGFMAAVAALSLGACGSDLAPPDDGDEASDERRDGGRGRGDAASGRTDDDEDVDDDDDDRGRDESPVGDGVGKDAGSGKASDEPDDSEPRDASSGTMPPYGACRAIWLWTQ